MQTKHGKQKEDCCFTLSHLIPEVRTNTRICMAQHPRQHISLCLTGQASPTSLIRLETIPTCSAQEEPTWLIFMKDGYTPTTGNRSKATLLKFKSISYAGVLENNPRHTGGPNLRSNYSFMKKTPCILQVFVWGDISDGRDKARMSKQPVGFSFSTKLTLGKKTWLGRPAALYRWDVCLWQQ